MFRKLRRARADLATMNTLFPAAERIALADGAERPGAEHLVLAALDLPDGLARSALAAAGITAADLRTAIVAQHADALSSIGLAVDDAAIDAALPPAGRPRGVFRSEGSLQATFQRAVALAKADRRELSSGDLLLAATEAEHGTVAGALDRLELDRAALRAALTAGPTGSA